MQSIFIAAFRIVILRPLSPSRGGSRRNPTQSRPTLDLYSALGEPYGPPVDHVVDPADNPVARGAYIAGPLAHCIDCHTPVISVARRDWMRTA